MKTLVFLLEEPSAKDFLEPIVPRLLPAGVTVRYLVFDGKSDLERSITAKLRSWRLPGSAFVILRDQDAADCKVVKKRLVQLASNSMKEHFLVRIACRELESWALGDWPAVAAGFGLPNLAAQGSKAAYRTPDTLANPVAELRKFIPTYQKRDGARRIGPHINIAKNRSRSFQTFCEGVTSLMTTLSERAQ